jgi:tyrosyl-tRNA synthetase
LIVGGGVSVNGVRIDHEKVEITLDNAIVIKVGKRRFLRVRKE